MSSPEQAVAEMGEFLGIPLQTRNVLAGTEEVPERLKIPEENLTSYLNNTLGIYSKGAIILLDHFYMPVQYGRAIILE